MADYPAAASDTYDVFLSHSHADEAWVEELAKRLRDEHNFKVWLDRWELVAGTPWLPAMAQGLERSSTCAVLLSAKDPAGWFENEIELALDRQSRDSRFRVIPVLMPGAPDNAARGFVGLRTWADFRAGKDPDYAFHVLVQGIKGQPVGPWPPSGAAGCCNTATACFEFSKRKLRELDELKKDWGLSSPLVEEYQRKILDVWFEAKS